ncbi:hypothetical protein GCM10007160_05040 [Litchfieldella qijiaojingensis]|uniref:UspA domain-containing protein n=1 Tax=Litchfieldella qijiaojingensis TaxID=980347 RepID=A0ABQ2YDI2_9GAMM|nr:universal stress protein [Halomonas qijiaojingensis]GGX80829.1 hypothetical protein GCM10007160_05040 [Halomonas qijiaojingensis]
MMHDATSLPDDAPNSGGAARHHVQARVLVLLDASRHSLAALSVAVDLACRRHAELVALFVEDHDLLRSTDFPFACEVGMASGMARPLSLSMLETHLIRQRENVRQALSEMVAGREVRHSLKVSRGRVVTEALALATRSDVLVLGKAGVSAQWGGRLGSTSRALVLQAPCTVLLWNETRPMERGPLLAIGESSAPAGNDWLVDNPLFDTVERLPEVGVSALERRLAMSPCGALLLSRTQLAHLVDEDPELLARLPLPLVVVP